MVTLTSIPVEILILVFESLSLPDFSALSLTCRTMHALVTDYGWSTYLQSSPRPSFSLVKARTAWSPCIRARYDVISDAAWSDQNFIARPLSRTWAGKLQPVLAINPSRLVVGAGSNLYSYKFGTDNSPSASPPVCFEGVVSLLNNPDRPRNITALTFVNDGGLDLTLIAAFQDGAVERVRLIIKPNSGSTALSCTREEIRTIPNSDFLESLTTQSNAILSLSANGRARLTSNDHLEPTSTPSPSLSSTSSTIELNTRSWVSHLSFQSSTPYAAFGTSSTTPLSVHAITNSGTLTQQPIAILHTKKTADLPLDKLPSSAVYGLSQAPLNSPWGSSPQIIVSGWFDGQVRIYDLRSSSRFSSCSTNSNNTPNSPSNDTNTAPNYNPAPASLRPVLSLADRWSHEPIYSVSCGGGSSAHIAAGTARHSVVSFWDVRSPNTGWSVHAPGNDPSPVYSVLLESSRFFGVTQSRPFVYDFGPGVTLDTYPPIPQIRGVDNLKQKKGFNRATYHTLRYTHNTSGLGCEH